MAITNADGIVTPDEDNTLDPEVYLAAMADSISEGIGVRLAKQEHNISAALNVAVGNMQAIAVDVTTTVDFAVCPGGYVNGMEVSGGVITIPVDGLYFVTTGVSFNVVADKVFTLEIVRNGGNTISRGHGQSVPFAAEDDFGFLTLNTMRRLVAGDTIRTTIYSHTDAGEIRALIQASNTLDIALIYAT